MNEFKLKTGFRQLFGTTVFGLLRTARLEQARHALHRGDCTVATAPWRLHRGDCTVGEAADLAGYKNQTHFTAAFKRHFGLLPRQVRG